MYHITTQIEVNASTEHVWSILMDFPSYAAWNPMLRSVEGQPVVGAILDVFIQLREGRKMRIRPRVLVVDQGRELRWKGRLLVPWLFAGDHSFVLETMPNGHVRLHQSEVFTGLLVPFMHRFLAGATTDGFVAMNRALKRRAEEG